MAFGTVQFSGGLRSRLPNSHVSKLCKEGRLKEALQMVELMVQQNTQIPITTYTLLLKVCTRKKAMTEGKRVHTIIVQTGLDSNISLGNRLVDMYAKCGSVLDAQKVFNTMPEHNVFSWTAIISAYANCGQGEEAMKLFEKMQQMSIEPDKVAYIVALKACARIGALEKGKRLHSDIIRCGFDSNVIVGNTLLDMYVKCGCTQDAFKVFQKMNERDVVSWNVMIAGYAQKALGKEAGALYEQMKQQGVQPDNVTYVLLLKACASIADLEQGKQLHSLIVRSGFDSNLTIRNTLIDMYAKCACIDHAREVFDNMHERDVVSWNVMIAGYAQQGLCKDALALYERMNQEGVQPDSVTYVAILKACASIAALEQGKWLHIHIIKRGLELHVNVGSALVDMYAKCGRIKQACQVFNNMHERNVVSWNAMLAGYAQHGLGKEALALYEKITLEGIWPDPITYAVLLKACASIAALEQGKQLHSQIIRDSCESDVIVGGALIDMYAKCGYIEHARQVFDNMHERNVVSWNAMISAYAQQGLGKEALELYERMKQDVFQPDNATYVVLLKACASVAALEEGAKIHSDIVESGFESDVIVGSAIADMYAKCGCIDYARQVFDRISERDRVSWNIMISGYAEQGLDKEAFSLYKQMKQEGLQPDNVTYIVLLKACASAAALEQGKQLHSDIIRSGLESNVVVKNTLVDMYAKCGCIQDAFELFNNMHERDIVSWNAMIAGCAQKGFGKEALTLFEQMRREGIKPNEVTYVGVLSACSHSGLVDEGSHLLDSLYRDQGVTLTVDHYACMVDLLSRAGRLADAEDIINNMLIQPSVVIWMTLLAAARNHCHVEIGRRAFEGAVKLEPKNAAAYVLLSNIYAAAGKRDEVEKIRKEMEDAGVKKNEEITFCRSNEKLGIVF